MKTQIRYLVHAFILCWLISDFLGAVLAQSPTCANNDQLVINTSTKTYQCITPGALPAGSGTTMIVANASSTGTTVNRLAKLTGAPSTAVITATTDTENAIGIVTGGAGTTGNATITILGQASCEFDGATTAGNYFTISATTAGKCHDAGSSFPTSGATYGRVLSTNGAGGTFVVEIMTPDVAFQNAGNGKSKPCTTTAGAIQYNNSGVFGCSGLAQTSSTRINFPDTTWNFGWGTGVGAVVLKTGTEGMRVENGIGQMTAVEAGLRVGATPQVYISNNVSNAGGIGMKSNQNVQWTSGSDASASGDTGMSRFAAKVVEFNSGSPLSAAGVSGAADTLTRKSLAYGTAPTIASGFGTGSTIAGRDEVFRVTLGTTPGTGGVVTFGNTYTNAPVCTANDETTLTVVLTTTPTTTNVTITAVTGVLVNADKIGVICRGYL